MPSTKTPHLNEWFERVWNKKDESAIEELMSPEVIIVNFEPRGVNGREHIKSVIQNLRRNFSDINIRVLDGWGNKDAEVAECMITATFKGKPVEATFTNVARIKDGKIILVSNDGDVRLANIARDQRM